MTSELQWDEQELVFLKQLQGADIEDCWQEHDQIIMKYNNKEDEEQEKVEELNFSEEMTEVSDNHIDENISNQDKESQQEEAEKVEIKTV